MRRWRVVLAMFLSGLFCLASSNAGAARAQTVSVEAPTSEAPPGVAVRWQLVVDGAAAAWDAPPWPADSLRPVARQAVRQLQEEGFYLARADSAAVDTSAALPTTVHLYVSRGPEVRLGRLRLRGAEVLDETALRALMDTQPGQVLSSRRLEADLQAILARYEAAGFPLAQIHVEETALRPGGEAPLLDLTLGIDEGGALHLDAIDVAGADRTSAAFVARATGLRGDAPLTDYDPQVLRERLEATGLFERVDAPELRVDEEGGATLRIPVEEASPGAFDFVLGYLPPAQGQPGRVVGNGQVALRNLFGGGRAFSLRLDRRAGQTNRAEVFAADPYFLGLPLRVETGFEGLQQDSTYGKQTYRLGLGYRFAEGAEVFGTLRREVTRPGQEGARLGDLVQQRVPRADAWFYGVGLRVRRLDDRLNPRRGFWLEADVAQGRKVRAARFVTAAQDTTRRREALQQKRLGAAGRAFVPTLARQVVAFGAEAAVLLSEAYDPSDLFRLGGAASLRGYDEDRFRGRAVGRALAEYRYQIDRRSFAYLFFDLGYVQAPAFAEGEEPARSLYPGYGLGLQFDTRLGLANVSYALNNEDGLAGGRVHLGLSVGL